MKNGKHEFASTCWRAEDIHSKREEMGLKPWTDEQAEEWLENNARHIVGDMVERGWDSIQTLLNMEDEDETD